MLTLTATDKKSFTAAKITEIEKFPSDRLAGPTVEPIVGYKAAILTKWKKRSAAELRAMVCIGSISQGEVTWSAESDLTAVEKAAVQDLIALGGKPVDVIVDVIGGKRSVEQRLAALEP